jgi:hypothetical protein
LIKFETTQIRTAAMRGKHGEDGMYRLAKNLLAILLLTGLFTVEVLAQGGATGAITGTVQDPTGAFVANADVRIINQDTGTVARVAKTDANGSFTVPLMPVGTYTVQISSPSFKETKFPGIVVRVTETTRMTAKLSPLQVLEKVEVQAEVQQVETTTAATGQAIESSTIRELPLATQNFEQLLTLYRRAERFEQLDAVGTRQCAHYRQRTTRGQQQLPHRGN